MSSFYPRRRQFSSNQQFNMMPSRFGMPRWASQPSLFGMQHPLDVFSSFMPNMLNQIIDPYLSQLMNQNLRWIEQPTRGSLRQQRQPRQQPQRPVSKKSSMGRSVPVKVVGKQQQQQSKRATGTVPSGKQMPQKYRILVGCTGVSPSSCRTQIKRVQDQSHLIVSGGERDRLFKRSFTLPLAVEGKKLSKFVTPTGQFCVEFPFQEMPRCLDIDLVPKICKGPEGKCVMVRVPIPEFVDPAKVQLSLKGRNELIVRFEERLTRCGDSVSRVYYYNCVTLPEGVNPSQIKAKADKHRLIITAPVRGGTRDISQGGALRTIPIERKLRQRKVKAVEPVTPKRQISGMDKKKKPLPVTPTSEKRKPLPVTPTAGEKKKEVKPYSGSEAVKKLISPKPSGTKLSELSKITPELARISTSETAKKPKTKKKSKTSTQQEGEKGSDILKKVFGTEKGTQGTQGTQVTDPSRSEQTGESSSSKEGQASMSDVISGFQSSSRSGTEQK